MRPSGIPVSNSLRIASVRYGACSGVSTMPGMDDVAADLVAGELDGQRLGQGDQRALGGGVGVLGAREAGERRHRAHVDDGAAAGALQMRDAVLGHPEHRLEVDRHDAVPPALVGLEHGAVAVLPQHAGVVVEDVQRAEAPHALVDHALHVGLDARRRRRRRAPRRRPCSIRAAVSFAAAASMSATTTRAPSSAKSTAVSRPMPMPPPVINATFPARRPLIRSSRSCAPAPSRSRPGRTPAARGARCAGSARPRRSPNAARATFERSSSRDRPRAASWAPAGSVASS